jgi:uncharacterized protein
VIVLLAVGILYAGSGYGFFAAVANVRGSCGQHAVNRPDRILFDDGWPPIDLSRYAMPDYQTVRFPSRQPGINIAGWWVPGEPDAPAVILVHGIGGCKNAIDVLVPAGMLWRNGFSVLLIDVRNVGDSDTDTGRTSAGNKEYLDVLGAWDWLVQEKGYAPERVGLFGASLGGATALYAFSEEPRAAALFLESTYAHLTEAFADNLRENGLPLFLANPAIVMGNLVSGGNLLRHDPVGAIRMVSNRPVYIVHSRMDQRISVREGEELAAAARVAGVNVTTWFPDKGQHLQTPAVYPDAFEQRLVGFFRDALSPAAATLPTGAATPVASAELAVATVAAPEAPTSKPIEMTRQPSITASEMRWDTNGGGQITFRVTRNGPDYDVAVNSYRFEDRHDRFTIDAESSAVYQALLVVMQDQDGILLDTSNAPTGSWTTLEFSDGEYSTTFKNVLTDGGLRIIYDYVVAQLEP